MITKHIQYKDKPLIWPLPNQCNWRDGLLFLGKDISLSFEPCFELETEMCRPMLESEGIGISIVKKDGMIQLLASDDDRINEEGYILEVTSEQIVVQAKTRRGMYYGLQSLMQLISHSNGKSIPFVTIVDSPFKPIRGVHIYVPPREHLDWFKRYVDFLAKYKFNTIFMEVGPAMKYDSHPEINEAWVDFCNEAKAYSGGADEGLMLTVGPPKDSAHIENGGGSYLEKEELANLVAYIKSRHIELIPEMQSLSHAYWLLMPHKECAERAGDPYPDTWCPSNPKIYEIYFDCLQEVLDLFKPQRVHIGHDELYNIGICEKCKDKTGHDILADDVIKIHDWLSERNVKVAMWGDKLFNYTSKSDGKPYGGRERLNFNTKTRKNELQKPTYRAVERIPQDILILDWYHSLNCEDTGSQDYYGERGFYEIFGNFDDIRWLRDGIPNIEERLRRPNVLGAECSLWHEVSDIGMALKDSLVYLLDAVNMLWSREYRIKMKSEMNNLIAQIYPLERDRMNQAPSYALYNDQLKKIDISGFYNQPLDQGKDYSLIQSMDKLPNTVPFEIGDSCILAGQGTAERISAIPVGDEEYRAIAFLHTYTEDLGRVPVRMCSYIDLEKDIVGQYVIEYEDGAIETVPIIYSRTITSPDNEFNAHWSNPVYQAATIKEQLVTNTTSQTIKRKLDPFVVFSYEWKNPHPDKKINSILLEHNKEQKGGIVLYGMTGIK